MAHDSVYQPFHLDGLSFACDTRIDLKGELVMQLQADAATFKAVADPVAAVADGTVDFAVGVDSLGSVRKAAANHDLFAIRCTYNPHDAGEFTPLYPEFDALAWLAKDVNVFEKLAAALLAPSAWHSIQLIGKPAPARMAKIAASLASRIQGTDGEAVATQKQWTAQLNRQLKKAVMPLPTVGEDVTETAALTSLAELAGCPQVVIPSIENNGSRSFIGPQHADAALVAYAIHRVRVHTGDC